MSATIPLPHLPPRSPDSHKGDFGRALLVGGSQGMAGSISLSGMATLRSGAGLVTIATADVCQPTVASFEPSYMTVPLPSDTDGRIGSGALAKIRELAARATAVACGPGMGRSDSLTAMVAALFREVAVPLVVDADGLNALAARGELDAHHAGPRILTPHPGEFARLVGQNDLSPDQRAAAAVELANRSRTIVVLKGHRTLVTDGRRQYVNTTGNPGMATGGTGDVLTGVITALLCQGLEAFEAAQLGVYVHGLAGDLAAEHLGMTGLIARDLINHLPEALRRIG